MVVLARGREDRVSTLETAGNFLRTWCLAVDDWIGQGLNDHKFQPWRTVGIGAAHAGDGEKPQGQRRGEAGEEAGLE